MANSIAIKQTNIVENQQREKLMHKINNLTPMQLKGMTYLMNSEKAIGFISTQMGHLKMKAFL